MDDEFQIPNSKGNQGLGIVHEFKFWNLDSGIWNLESEGKF
jgi:hypothetical protein